MKQEIEELADKPCQAVLSRTEDGRLIAGFQLPIVSTGATSMFCLSVFECMLIKNRVQNENSRNLLDAVNKDGQELHILRLDPIPWDPKSGAPKPKMDERDPFPAKIIVTPLRATERSSPRH